MNLSAKDSDNILNLIEKGTLLPGTFVAILLISIASVILLGSPGLWPLFVILPLFVVLSTLANISAQYSLHAEDQNSNKLTILEEFCLNFRNIMLLDMDKIFLNKFNNTLDVQCRSSSWSKIFSSITFGFITSTMLMGGLYLNWCDTAIETNLLGVLILIILFSYFMACYMAQYSECIEAFIQGKNSLEKVKSAFILEPTVISFSKPKKEYYATIENALFSWPKKENDSNKINQINFHLKIDLFNIRKGDIVGITGATGSGKTMFAYSILGHTIHKHGELRLKQKFEYHPTELFILNGSIKDNILMGADFDSKKFYTVIVDTKLQLDVLTEPGFEDLHIMSMNLKPHQMQRICLARALYSDSEAFIFDEPFKNVLKSNEMLVLVTDILFKIQIQGKTVILISSTKEFLSTCQYIYCIDNGTLTTDNDTRGTYESFIQLPKYDEMLFNAKLIEASSGFHEAFEGAHMNGLATKTTSKKNSSNEQLKKQNSWFSYISFASCCSILTIFILSLINSFNYFIIPFCFIKWHDYKHPWITYICIAIIFITITLDITKKCVFAKLCEKQARNNQQNAFEKLRKTSIECLQNMYLTDIVNCFAMSNLDQGTSSTILNGIGCLIGVAFSSTILILANYWTSIPIGVQIIFTLLLWFVQR